MNKNVIKHLGFYITDLNINNKTMCLLFLASSPYTFFIYQ